MLVQPDVATVATKRRGGGDRTDDLRDALRERFAELRTEYAEAVADMALAGAADAGDDIADLGTKAFSREQEFALAVAIKSRMDQVEHALERLEAGRYGSCETCKLEIPVARLAAYPAATLCVKCKSASERR
jgi:DnaK suppressor protein